MHQHARHRSQRRRPKPVPQRVPAHGRDQQRLTPAPCPGKTGVGRPCMTRKSRSSPSSMSAKICPDLPPWPRLNPNSPTGVEVRSWLGIVGQTLHGDAQRAAPAVVQRDVGELGKDLQHRAPDERPDVARKAIAMAPPPLNSIRRSALSREKLTTAAVDRNIVADQRPTARLAQRLGGDDEGVDRHHPGRGPQPSPLR